MAGSGVSLYATTAAGNKTVIGTIDWREDVYMPSQINDNVAQIMADIRAMANAVATGWIEIGDGEGVYTATYVSATSFRFDGVDVTAYYRAGMRVRVVAPTPGTLSGTITSSAFSTHTTLVVAWDSGSLSNEAITSVSIGVGSGDTASPAATAQVVHDCRLDYVSTSQIRLNRHNGYQLTIDNLPQTIPAAGVNLAPTGGGGGTRYYVYAFMSAGVMTLELSATTYAVDTRNGLKTKSGDATRTLVGMVYIVGGPAFIFATLCYGVKSYYNRRDQGDSQSIGTTTASTTLVQISGSVIFLAWTDEYLAVQVMGSCTNATPSAVSTTSILNAAFGASATATIPVASGVVNMSCANYINGTEAPQTTYAMGAVNAGTGTWSGICTQLHRV